MGGLEPTAQSALLHGGCWVSPPPAQHLALQPPSWPCFAHTCASPWCPQSPIQAIQPNSRHYPSAPRGKSKREGGKAIKLGRDLGKFSSAGCPHPRQAAPQQVCTQPGLLSLQQVHADTVSVPCGAAGARVSLVWGTPMRCRVTPPQNPAEGIPWGAAL